MRKLVTMGILLSSIISFSDNPFPTINQEVTGRNLQQLEYKKIVNTNDLLKNQNIESTNMEIVGDLLKRQKQRIKIIQSDSIQIEEEIVKGKSKGFFGSLFN
ncbi:MAG: hypothetical protein ACRCVS_04720 [Fusobacteriaceae bacterium]